MNREAAARTRADPIRSMQIASAIVQFWRTWGADRAATQHETVRFVRWSMEAGGQPAPKPSTIVRVLYALVGDGFLHSRSAGSRTVLYWPNPSRVDPSFPGFDREAEAILCGRDTFPVFDARGRAWLVALDGGHGPSRVALHLRRPHVGPFAWWRSLWYAVKAAGVEAGAHADAVEAAAGAARRALLEFLWQAREQAESWLASCQARLLAAPAIGRVRREHRYGASCPDSCCPKERASTAMLLALEQRFGRSGDLEDVYRRLDGLVAHHVARESSRPAVHADGGSREETWDTLGQTLGALDPSRRSAFRQWERVWPAALIGSSCLRSSSAEPVLASNAAVADDRGRVVRLVRGHGRDPVQAAREVGVSFVQAAQWVDDYDRVALLASRVAPDLIASATGLGGDAVEQFLRVWREVATASENGDASGRRALAQPGEMGIRQI